MRLNPNALRVSGILEYDRQNLEHTIKTDGPQDLDKPQGSYVVLRADGSVLRRTLDATGLIIHEISLTEKSDV